MVRSVKPALWVVFYRTENGREPVRDWLRGLDRDAKKVLGEDIKTVQYGWPLGMPLVRPLGDGLFEVRSELRNRIARVVFLVRDSTMVLLHGFVKKDRKIPLQDLRVARQRAATL